MDDWKQGTGSQTEYVGRCSPQRVTVTRRHHPIKGKIFDVVNGGRQQLVIRLDDQSTMRIPRSWTDADGAQPEMDAPERMFTTDAMRELGALVAAMARRRSEAATSSSRTELTEESLGGESIWSS